MRCRCISQTRNVQTLLISVNQSVLGGRIESLGMFWSSTCTVTVLAAHVVQVGTATWRCACMQKAADAPVLSTWCHHPSGINSASPACSSTAATHSRPNLLHTIAGKSAATVQATVSEAAAVGDISMRCVSLHRAQPCHGMLGVPPLTVAGLPVRAPEQQACAASPSFTAGHFEALCRVSSHSNSIAGFDISTNATADLTKAVHQLR